jgi:hypothetical protein
MGLILSKQEFLEVRFYDSIQSTMYHDVVCVCVCD